MSRHGGESHRELRSESPAKLRYQKLGTATLGVHEPPQPCNVHCRLAKGKNDMDHSWAFVAQTHVSELGGEGMFQEREKQGGLQAAVPSHSHCLAVRFPSQCQGLSSDLQARGPGKCSLQNVPK